jgi:hypothetical protein
MKSFNDIDFATQVSAGLILNREKILNFVPTTIANTRVKLEN